MAANKIHIETLTPLHIGSGAELMGNFEYLFFAKDRRISLISEEKVLQILGKGNIDQWLSIIDRSESLLKYLQQRDPNLTPEKIAKRIMMVSGEGPKSTTAILEQNHDGSGRPMLPGSSLKGAIRTAVFAKTLHNKPDLVKKKHLIGKDGHRGFQFRDNGLEKTLLGKTANEDLFRLLRVGDAHFSHTEVFKTFTLNKRNKGWEFDERISPFVECIPAGLSSIANLSQPGPLLDFLKKNSRKTPFSNKANMLEQKELFSILNNHTTKLIEDEMLFWAEEGNPALAGTYFEELTKIKDAIDTAKQNEGECILRVGFGSGIQFITGGWQKDLMSDDLYKDWANSFRGSAPSLAFAKTRKLSHDSQPLGFLKISLLSDEKAAQLASDILLQENKSKAQLKTTYTPPKVKPQYPKKGTRIRKGTEVDAYVFTSPKGKEKKIRIYLGSGNEVDLFLTYPSDAILGKIIVVKITDIQDEKVTHVKFQRIKRENRS